MSSAAALYQAGDPVASVVDWVGAVIPRALLLAQEQEAVAMAPRLAQVVALVLEAAASGEADLAAVLVVEALEAIEEVASAAVTVAAAEEAVGLVVTVAVLVTNPTDTVPQTAPLPDLAALATLVEEVTEVAADTIVVIEVIEVTDVTTAAEDLVVQTTSPWGAETDTASVIAMVGTAPETTPD